MPLRLLKKEDSHEFKPLLSEIEEDPGSPLGPLTFWLVTAVFGFFVLWAIFGQVDVVVTARGKAIPLGQSKLIQPLNGGVVSQILVKEGDFVKKGQALVVIDPSTTEPTLDASQKTLAHVQLEEARLQAASGRGHFQSDGSNDSATQARIYASSLAALEKQLSAKEKALETTDAQIQAKQVEVLHTKDLLKVNTEREKRLHEVRDIIAKDEYEKVQNEITTGQSKLQALTHELDQLSFQKQQTIEEMGYIQQNFKQTTLTDLSEKEKQITQLKATLDEATFRNARQTLLAPVDGYVHELFIHTVGGVVTPAQKIVSIVPINTPLQVQSVLLNKDVGFVKPGMPVAIKVDAFEFQKYGTLKGVVTQVDKDSKDDPKLGPVYTVYVNPLEHTLKVDGKQQTLSTGMSLMSEIKVGKRRIIEFFIYPLIKHLDEGMSVR